MGPVARCAVQRGARRTMPSSSTTSTFLSTAPSDDGAAMSAESGGVAAAVWASFAGRVSEGDNVANQCADYLLGPRGATVRKHVHLPH